MSGTTTSFSSVGSSILNILDFYKRSPYFQTLNIRGEPTFWMTGKADLKSFKLNWFIIGKILTSDEMGIYPPITNCVCFF